LLSSRQSTGQSTPCPNGKSSLFKELSRFAKLPHFHARLGFAGLIIYRSHIFIFIFHPRPTTPCADAALPLNGTGHRS
jgi:hypothetical protein